MNRKRQRWKAEHIGAVRLKIIRNGLEVDPTKDQGERNCRRNHATPHQQPMRRAAQLSAPPDERIESKHDSDAARELKKIEAQVARLQKELPAADPVTPSRRALKPHRVPIRNAK